MAMGHDAWDGMGNLPANMLQQWQLAGAQPNDHLTGKDAWAMGVNGEHDDERSPFTLKNFLLTGLVLVLGVLLSLMLASALSEDTGRQASVMDRGPQPQQEQPDLPTISSERGIDYRVDVITYQGTGVQYMVVQAKHKRVSGITPLLDQDGKPQLAEGFAAEEELDSKEELTDAEAN